MVEGLTGKYILAVGAHPDDVEFGCFGTLDKLVERNQVSVLVLTGKGTIREEETREAFRYIIPCMDVLDFPDGKLQETQEAVAAVEKAAKQSDVILTQSHWDTHQDHRAVEGIVLAAARRRPMTILGYHLISSTPAFPVNLVVDIKDNYERKLDALACHESQRDKPYFDCNFLRAWHREKLATAVGLDCVELFHLYQSFWRP